MIDDSEEDSQKVVWLAPEQRRRPEERFFDLFGGRVTFRYEPPSRESLDIIIHNWLIAHEAYREKRRRPLMPMMSNVHKADIELTQEHEEIKVACRERLFKELANMAVDAVKEALDRLFDRHRCAVSNEIGIPVISEELTDKGWVQRALKDGVLQQTVNLTEKELQRTLRGDVGPPRKWNKSRLEKAILDAMKDIENTGLVNRGRVAAVIYENDPESGTKGKKYSRLSKKERTGLLAKFGPLLNRYKVDFEKLKRVDSERRLKEAG